MFRRFVLLIAATLPIAVAADIRVVEEIAAKVNGDIITRGELEQQRKELEIQLRAEGLAGAKLTDAVKQSAANALRDEIDQLLLVQRAKDLNINVDPDVTRELADMQVRTKITDHDKFQQVIQQQYGMSYEDFRDRMKRQYLAQRVIGQEVGSRVNIPESDLHKYYDEHKSRIRAQGAGLPQPDPDLDRGQDARTGGGRREEGQGHGGAGAQGREVHGPGARQFRRSGDGAQRRVAAAHAAATSCRRRSPRLSSRRTKGYVTDPIKVPQGFVILRIDERYDGRAGHVRGSEGRDQDRLARPLMEPKIREYLTRLRAAGFPRDQGRLRGQRRRARQGHALAGRGPVEAADHHQGRSRVARRPAQEAVLHPDSLHFG